MNDSAHVGRKNSTYYRISSYFSKCTRISKQVCMHVHTRVFYIWTYLQQSGGNSPVENLVSVSEFMHLWVAHVLDFFLQFLDFLNIVGHRLDRNHESTVKRCWLPECGSVHKWYRNTHIFCACHVGHISWYCRSLFDISVRVLRTHTLQDIYITRYFLKFVCIDINFKYIWHQ